MGASTNANREREAPLTRALKLVVNVRTLIRRSHTLCLVHRN